jgi:hypothetical protein
MLSLEKKKLKDKPLFIRLLNESEPNFCNIIIEIKKNNSNQIQLISLFSFHKKKKQNSNDLIKRKNNVNTDQMNYFLYQLLS